jgi:hypothetical protein
MTEDTTVPAPELTRPRLSRLTAWVIVPAVLGGLVFAQARMVRLATCETYDEFTYLRMGICIYRHGDFQSLASPMCPPMPILLEYALPALSAKSLPDTPGWEWEVPRLIRQARLSTSVLIGIPLVWTVYAWLARRRGWVAGALGGGLVALSPTVLAAASIATTDACFALFALVALVVLHRYQVAPSRRSFVAAGAAMGLALASKQSAVFLAPVALLELFLKSPGRKPGSTRVDACLRVVWWVGWRLSALIVLAFMVDWAIYGFGLAPSFRSGQIHATLPVIVPMVADLFPNGDAIMEAVRQFGPPLAIDTFVGQVDHATTGHTAFLMGEYSYQGWWYFFPVAIALKSTPAELAAMALVLFMAVNPANWRDPARRLWLTSVAVMLGLGMASKINIGHRYMLLIYPLTALLAADRLGEHARRGLIVVALLVAWQAASAFGVAPYYLCYFNSFSGGPSEGYRYLVDSSFDWGQDLPALRKALEARGYHKVALCYFGTGRPFAYGLRSMNWMDLQDPFAEGCDWLAVSATALQGVYVGAPDLRQRLESLPSARAGYTFFLYDLKDPRVRAVYEELRKAPTLPGVSFDPEFRRQANRRDGASSRPPGAGKVAYPGVPVDVSP